MRCLTPLARTVAATGLLAVAGVHAVWASGSTWPERNRRRLSEAVIGHASVEPGRGATAAVAAGAAAGGIIAGGALGDGRGIVATRRAIGLALLARGILGGNTALISMGLPEGGKRFQELDERLYRPLCLVLGVATLIGARGPRASRRPLRTH
ncbi:DUF3995 domain-containing protein [Leucobacter rhizosphaerae]|uniref:DUF3995 domain-containing protein n=1 Tax=Leucobacter rhizosphaerae TaxID=2932245 RepID=A0ABY4FYP5_9MICO|nr:DUF3995 domain-containing protein [Leucobacter rhizosphaerae]UOQ61351.1 DUF3995 domain-containing protein [Leucobacter rhizosphaerae]